MPAEQVLSTVAQQREILASERARVAEFTRYHANEIAKLEAERVDATHDLVQALLPSLEPRVIAWAAEVSGLAGLPSEDIPAKVAARRAADAQRLGAIAADPRFANRELLMHPRTGSLTRELAEAEELRQPAVSVIDTCEQSPRFDRLWQSGYGAPDFSAPFWRYSYWEDHRAANALLAKFPGKTTFGEVRAAYESAVQTRDTFDAEIARVRETIAACDALAREHATLLDEQAHLDERALAITQKRIVQHLLTSDTSLVSQRLQPWPDIRMLFLRASGLAAKIVYLEGIERAHVADVLKEVATQEQRLGDVEFRTRRRWAAMPLEKWQKLAIDRRPRYEKRWQRVGKVYGTVHAYDRWDRGSYYDDLLWWDVMTRGRYDGSYLPDVAAFHEGHPDYVFDPDYKALKAEAELDAESAAAAAAIDADMDAPTDLVQADAS
jgi:hypothetical protein